MEENANREGEYNFRGAWGGLTRVEKNEEGVQRGLCHGTKKNRSKYQLPASLKNIWHHGGRESRSGDRVGKKQAEG